MATYPTPAEIDAAVPVDGIPDRTKTNAVLKKLSDAPTWEQVTGKPTAFPPVTGTTAETAKPGNYQPTWAQVTGKPATFTPTIGTTETTAAAGNHSHDLATGAANGFMSADDKAKMDLIPDPSRLLREVTAAPATPTSPGSKGDFFMGNDEFYVCIAPDTWRVMTLMSWGE